MNHLRVILNPTHRAQSQPIQPIDFIKRWSLCHDLSQVVIHLERTAHFHCDNHEASLHALKTAQGYLLNKYISECISLSLGRIHDSFLYNSLLFPKMRTSPFPMMAEAIAKEWGLSNHLKEVIFYITVYKNFYPLFPSMRPVFLKQALKHLRREISAKEQIISISTETKGGKKDD